eukprot:gene4385-5394_t
MAEKDEADLYAVLGVEATVDVDELKKIYRKLVLKCHPDKVRNPDEKPAAEKRFQEISKAYEILSDPVKRTQYDQRAGAAGAKTDDVMMNISLKDSALGCRKLEFDAATVTVPVGAKTGDHIDIPGKIRSVRVNVLPSKLFKRVGDDVHSTLKLTAKEAEEGGPFDVETLFSKEMIFLEENVASGKTYTCVPVVFAVSSSTNFEPPQILKSLFV